MLLIFSPRLKREIIKRKGSTDGAGYPGSSQTRHAPAKPVWMKRACSGPASSEITRPIMPCKLLRCLSLTHATGSNWVKGRRP